MNKANLSAKAENILSQIHGKTMMGDLRKIAKAIKQDHELAMELWSTGQYMPRLLAALVMDKKQLSRDRLNQLVQDLQIHAYDERNTIMDWLMANQLTKSKNTVAMMESWENSPSALQRRIFWYYQARLRWTGQTPPDNTAYLLSRLEANMAQEEPEVQWAMNLAAGWIGVYDEQYRARCMKLGEVTGLYKDQKVPKGCTPSYLPDFIAIEVNKRQ